MRFTQSKSAVTANLLAAMTARLFYGLALDAPEAANAAWLAVPVGLLLSLPLMWLVCRFRAEKSRALAGLLLVGLLIDAASAAEWTAYSESCLAFDHISPVLLTLPLLLALARVVWLGGDAVGGAARFWARLFVALMLVVVLFQLPYYDAGWLVPWLGNGWGSVLRSGVRAAGWNVLLCASAVSVCGEPLGLRDLLPGLLLASAVAAALILLRQMMAPVVTARPVTRAMAIDALLTNGRAPLYLQLPMIVAWFAGMLHLMAFESLAACGLLKRLLPQAQDEVCVGLALITVSALALTGASRLAGVRQALSYLYHALAALTVMLSIRRKPCENPA